MSQNPPTPHISPPALCLQPARHRFGYTTRQVNTATNTDPKIPIRADLTMNPGASWTFSMGMVRSRIATSPNTSSAMGTMGWAERWAMKWNWEAQLFSAPGGNLSVWLISSQVGEIADGLALARRYSSLPVVSASPAACLLFYISLEIAKSDLDLCSACFPCACNLLFGQWMKAAPRKLVPWREKCFYTNPSWWEEKPAAH